MQVTHITLESLLDETSKYNTESFKYSVIIDDTTEAALECIDLFDEIAIIEQNLITIEAAKTIKRATGGVEYESFAILALEAVYNENLHTLKLTILKAIISIRNFFISIAKKLIGIFQNLDQYIRANGNAIMYGLNSTKEIPCKYKIRGNEGNEAVSTVKKYLKDIDNAADDTAGLIVDILGSEAKLSENMKDFERIKHDEMFEPILDEKIALNELHYSVKKLNEIGGIVLKGQFENTRRKAMENIQNTEALAKKLLIKLS
jgi:hypothetical protein